MLDPEISFRLEDDYQITTGELFLPLVTTHHIAPGTSHYLLVINFEIKNYNLTFPPNGIYTLWVEVDATIIPFKVKSYDTNILYKNNQTVSIIPDQSPFNWGSIPWFPVNLGFLSLLILLFIEILVGGVFVYRKVIPPCKKPL